MLSGKIFCFARLGLLLTGLFLLGTNSSFAQTVTVKDAASGKPLSFVAVGASSGDDILYSNDSGKAEISLFAGSDTLFFSLLGYQPKTIAFTMLRANGFTVNLLPFDIRLDEVVVTASRWAQSRSELIHRVSSISAADIALQNPQTAADLLGSAGEVFIQKSQQGGGSPMIRGYAANRLLISVDGVRMNNAIFRSGNLHNIISIDPFAVERAEVLFGPGSVMFGSDAIGGVINFNLLKPEFSSSGDLKTNGTALMRYGSANTENTGHIMFKAGGRKWASVSSVSYNSFGNLRMGSYGPDAYLRPEYISTSDGVDAVIKNDAPQLQVPTSYKQLNLMQKLRYKPNEAFDLTYTFLYANTGDFDRYDRLIQYRGEQLRSAEWYYGPQLWVMQSMGISHLKATSLYDEAIFTIAWQQFGESRHDRGLNSNRLRNRIEKVHAYNVQADFKLKPSENSDLFYGFEAVANDVVSTGTDKNIASGDIVEAPSRYPQSNTLSLGVFANYRYRFSQKLMAGAGLRFTQYKLHSRFDAGFYDFPFDEARLIHGAVTGSLGMVYNPSTNWTLSSNISTGFRSPNVDDIGKVFDSEPGAVIVPNPELKPEYAQNIDFGFARFIGKSVKIDFTAFFSLLDDALVRRPFSFNGADSIMYDGEMSRVLAIQNAASAKVYGVQAGLEVKFPQGFSWYSTLSWQKGEEELDDGSKSPLRHAAPFFGRSRLEYKQHRFGAEIAFFYSSQVPYEAMPDEEISKAFMYAKDVNGNPYSPSWYILNLKTNYDFGKGFSASAGIENILDKRYRPYSSGLAGAGRNFIVSLRYAF